MNDEVKKAEKAEQRPSPPTRAACEEALGALEELFDALPPDGRAKHAGDKADVRRVLEMMIRYLGTKRDAEAGEPEGERNQDDDEDDDADEPQAPGAGRERGDDEEEEDDLLDQILEDVETLTDEERAELFGLIANLYDVETGKPKEKPRTRRREIREP